MENIFKDLFIFDMANNHNGSVEHGLAIIDAVADVAQKHNIRVGIKFQYRDLDTLIHPDYRDREDVKHIPRFIANRLSSEEFLKLANYARDKGLVTVATPFDEASVRLCIDNGIDIIKIASCSANDWPLLEAVAGASKPVIISTAGLSIHDIDDVVSYFTHKEAQFAIMHCVALYPTPNNMFQMNFMERMIKRYPRVPVGYSGHGDPANSDVAKIAIAKGAHILERHVGIATDEVELNKYSMNPEEIDAWVVSALVAKEITGVSNTKHVAKDEIDSLMSLKRGVYVKNKVSRGEVIKREDVFFSMPCAPGQLTSGDFGKYRAEYVASKDYEVHEAVYEDQETVDSIRVVRTVVHDVKGLLAEASIHLDGKMDLELSHHYGVDSFRRIGATILSVVNREYCKKLIVLLPGQENPSHKHEIKEETFQLLHGDLEIDMDGKLVQLQPGDTLLVERGQWHSFRTDRGAVIEEISTTHARGDSYYKDEKIASLDPMERKTILTEW